MALLEQDREATPDTGAPPADGAAVPSAPDFACEDCGGAMQRGQDWCLECGTAAPGRLGARPGWRAAFTVVGLTTLLLCCAVVAAYAALTSDAQRTASAPAAGSADPIVASTPGATTTPTPATVEPGVTGPGVLPKVAPPAGGAALIPKVNPQALLPAKPAAPAAPAAPPSKAAGATAATAAPELISLRTGAAQTYDPDKRAGAEFGPAAFAIDPKPNTVWDVVVPADGQPIDAGLVIDLGKPYALRSLRIATPTDGFTVEIYGAKSAKELPADVIDKRWVHLTDEKSVVDGAPILLNGKGGGAKVRLLLLHLKQPGNVADPRVAIGGVLLRGTPSQ